MFTDRVLFGLLVTLAAGGSGAAPSHSGVAGTISQAPGCPGPQRPQQGECIMPVAGVNVELLDVSGKKLIATGATGSDGRFRIDAPAARYRLHVAVEGVNPRCEDIRVTVRKGKLALANLRCDSGMR